LTYHDIIAKCGVGSGHVTQKDSPGKKNPENVQVGLPKVLVKEYSTPKQENKQKHNRITLARNRFIENWRTFCN
jgi:hypothetical protein